MCLKWLKHNKVLLINVFLTFNVFLILHFTLWKYKINMKSFRFMDYFCPWFPTLEYTRDFCENLIPIYGCVNLAGPFFTSNHHSSKPFGFIRTMSVRFVIPEVPEFRFFWVEEFVLLSVCVSSGVRNPNVISFFGEDER